MSLSFGRPAVAILLILAASAAVAAGADHFVFDLASTRSDLSVGDARRVRDVTRPTADFSKAEAFEAMPGGAATSLDAADRNAFSHASANIPVGEQDFSLGKALFKKLWVSAPSSTQASDGLGPLFNARSCMSCHAGDGRGKPPRDDATPEASMVLRLARPAQTAQEQREISAVEALNFADPTYGRQLQELAVPGLAAEGRFIIRYTEKPVTLAGGEVVTLRRPVYSIRDLGYGSLDPHTTISPRVAPQIIGLGLIEAIADADILAHADPQDVDGDGIKGKAAIVRDHRTGEIAIGRFGWKAQNATVRDQSADALSTDIGISSPDEPDPAGDCTEGETQCRRMPTGVQERLGPVEAPDPVLALLSFYSANLAVPARRDVSRPDVLRGKQVFYAAGCPSCHVPKFVTRRDAGNPASAFQLIWPYSDLLLHDMGEALADEQQVGLANGRDWRTPPLWGIGLTQTVSGHSFFLHDGRARNLTEAILWHGGEAERARAAFAGLPKDDRQALITFVESL